MLGIAEQVAERSFFFGGWAAPPSSDSSLVEASMAWPGKTKHKIEKQTINRVGAKITAIAAKY